MGLWQALRSSWRQRVADDAVHPESWDYIDNGIAWVKYVCHTLLLCLTAYYVYLNLNTLLKSWHTKSHVRLVYRAAKVMILGYLCTAIFSILLLIIIDNHRAWVGTPSDATASVSTRLRGWVDSGEDADSDVSELDLDEVRCRALVDNTELTGVWISSLPVLLRSGHGDRSHRPWLLGEGDCLRGPGDGVSETLLCARCQVFQKSLGGDGRLPAKHFWAGNG